MCAKEIRNKTFRFDDRYRIAHLSYWARGERPRKRMWGVSMTSSGRQPARHRVRASLIASVFLMSCLITRATALFGVANFSTDISGNAAFNQIWNTLGGDTFYNLYIDDGSGFVNSGDGSSASINITLTPGVHTYSIYGDPGLANRTWALNLFFNGDTTTPGISAVNSDGAAGTSLFADSGSTLTLAGNSVTGAGTLQFIDGFTTVTLTSYTFSDVAALDRVSPFSTSPNTILDFAGSFTLDVVATPEPASAALLGASLVFLAAYRRRRSGS